MEVEIRCFVKYTRRKSNLVISENLTQLYSVIVPYVRYSLCDSPYFCAIIYALLPWVLSFSMQPLLSVIVVSIFFLAIHQPSINHHPVSTYSSSLVPIVISSLHFYYFWPLYHKIRHGCPLCSTLFCCMSFLRSFSDFFFRIVHCHQFFRHSTTPHCHHSFFFSSYFSL